MATSLELPSTFNEEKDHETLNELDLERAGQSTFEACRVLSPWTGQMLVMRSLWTGRPWPCLHELCTGMELFLLRVVCTGMKLFLTSLSFPCSL